MKPVNPEEVIFTCNELCVQTAKELYEEILGYEETWPSPYEGYDEERIVPVSDIEKALKNVIERITGN